MDRHVSNAIAGVVTFVWAASFIADIALAEYSPSPFVHMIMMGLAGATFGQGFIKTMNGTNGAAPKPPEPHRELTPEQLADAARDFLRQAAKDDEK